jgi:hypothetical protein
MWMPHGGNGGKSHVDPSGPSGVFGELGELVTTSAQLKASLKSGDLRFLRFLWSFLFPRVE